MSTSYGLNVETPTTVLCHTYAEASPILSIFDGSMNVSISAHRADSALAETFARDVLAAAQEFYDATVEHIARTEQVPA